MKGTVDGVEISRLMNKRPDNAEETAVFKAEMLQNKLIDNLLTRHARSSSGAVHCGRRT